MKTILKHISLLMISGLMIPLYDVPPVTADATAVTAKYEVKKAESFHFSFLHDVAAKLLPIANYLK